jgi:hypothetical protein
VTTQWQRNPANERKHPASGLAPLIALRVVDQPSDVYRPSVRAGGNTYRLVLAGALVAAVAACTTGRIGGHEPPGPNPIELENQHLGTDSWRITERSSDQVHHQVEGYSSATSVNIGGSITLFVSVSPAQSFSISIYRVGYYQGLGARLVQTIPGMAGIRQQSCPMDLRTGMIACRWKPSYHLAVPTDWTTGVYLAKLENSQHYQSYVTFTVRQDQRHSDVLYQQSVTTYQAYNNYPDDSATSSARPATGKSLYEGGSSSVRTGLGTTRAVQVSFDRPYAGDHGAGDFLNWEIYFVWWLERSGYDVSYSTDIDTHTDGRNLLNHKAFLSVGHDEYWSRAMYDAATTARDSGVGLGFFGANAAYWQMRLGADRNGVPNRVMVCYKDTTLDPVKDLTTTVRWRDKWLNRPEQQLIGIQFSSEQPAGAPPAPFVATNLSNWAFGGAGLPDGRAAPSVVGYESDRLFDDIPRPEHVPDTYVLLSRSPYTTLDGASDFQNSVVYQARSGAWVFGAGSIEWSWGLYDDATHQFSNRTIQKITAQVMNRLVGPRTAPPPARPHLMGRATAAGAVVLSWSVPGDTGGEYLLQRSTTRAFTQSSDLKVGSQRRYTDPNLSPDVYYYRLRSMPAVSPTVYSDVATVVTASYDALVTKEPDLLAWWRPGDARGATEAGGAGQVPGRYLGGVTLGATGAIETEPDRALTLDGSSGTVSLPEFRTVADFSIMGWTNLAAQARVPTVASPGNNTLYGSFGKVRIMVRPGGTTSAYAGVWLRGTEYALQPDAGQSNLNSWVFWTLTRSGSSLTLYRNGSIIATRTDLPLRAAADINGWIGSQSGSDYFLSGGVDEVAVYGRAVSAETVATLYQAATAERATQ